MRYRLCGNTEFFAAYQFTANYVKPFWCEEQIYNVVRVGVGFKF